MAQEEVFVSYSREDNDKVLALTRERLGRIYGEEA